MAARRSKMKGMAAHRRALRRLPDALKGEISDGQRATVEDVYADAKALFRSRFTERSGTALRWYRRSVSARALNARVGYLSKRARGEAFYARFLHDGTVHITGFPFHDMAVESALPGHERRMKAAVPRAFRVARLR